MAVQPSGTLDDVAQQFVTHRPKLYAIAHRALGSPWGADDAVQEAWLRLQRTDIATIKNLEAWLTTVISRVCIDTIRQQASRREDLDGGATPEAERSVRTPAGGDPSESLIRIDDLGLAMQVVLDRLGPLERLALVLHDVFALSFDDIAPIVERTPAAARQLASRARARLRAVDVGSVRERQEAAIGAFLDAARHGDFGRLLQLLDPEIELRSDGAAVELAAAGADHGAPLLAGHVRGVDAVARVFAGRAELTRLVFVDGIPAAAYVADGTVHAVYLITFADDRIATLDVLADVERLAGLRTVV
ncbi:sigma-70 family RNA polymerase sigma factor [Occultella glacieicola]|uniref:Sigma-70 family RNA polymerase sigma factor n=1 Tax=Occultella glacieicola TaxID=2518684 RepID=A0ABY2EAT3_9MICO|nr:sigma-70 family RNA polymerase sigma factor [Occultella glacieicola]TDE99066.1 sigma-70 family RNA polymerase sigma factor [Occultella glacieicola]